MIGRRILQRHWMSDKEIRTIEQSKVNYEKMKQTKHRRHLNLLFRMNFCRTLILLCLFSTSSFFAITKATASAETEKNGG